MASQVHTQKALDGESLRPIDWLALAFWLAPVGFTIIAGAVL